MPESRPTVRELVLVPAIITLAVTVLRLVGELQGWSPRFFSRQGGGGGAVVGIVWLVFVFGVYFAWRLVKAGEGPPGVGRAIGFSVAGLAVVFATLGLTNALKVPQLAIIVIVSLVFLLGAWIACQGWPELGRVLFVYALAARVPVAALMLPAILGNWGTHYDAAPPNFPAMAPFAKWALIGLFPQLTLWIGFTIIIGLLCGSITAAIMRGGRRTAVADAA